MRFFANVYGRLAATRLPKRASTNSTAKSRRRLQLEPLEDRTLLTSLFVDAARGDDANPGTAGKPFASIQRAIYAADEFVSPGADNIFIRPGAYYENLHINDADPLTLRGLTGDPTKVVIHGKHAGDVIDIFDSKQVNILFVRVTAGEQGIQATNMDSLMLNHVLVDGNKDDGLDAEFVNKVTIHHSEFVHNGDDGADIERSGKLNIFNSSFSHNGENGLELKENGEILLHAVNAKQNGGLADPEGAVDEDAFDGDGLSVYGTNKITVRRGIYSENVDDGMFIQHAGHVTIISPLVEYNGEDGVDVEESGNAKVIAGKYRGNGDDGVELSAESVYVTAAISEGNHEDGLDIDGAARVKINAGVFSKNDGDGLDLSNIDDLWVTGVKAQHNGDGKGDDGLAIDNVEDIWLTGGLFLSNYEDGVDLDYIGAVKAKGVVAKDNGEDGFDVDGANYVTIVGGFFQHNGEQGIDLDGESQRPIHRVIVNNALSRDNAAQGIAIDDVYIVSMSGGNYMRNGLGGVEITDVEHIRAENVLSRFNGGNGIAIGTTGDRYARSVAIVRGQYSFNKFDGVHIQDTGAVRLYKVLGIRNGDNGLEVINSGPVDLGGSTFVANRGQDILIHDLP